MSDDSFIREVNEQIRQERMTAFWSRFGKFVIAGVIVAVVATIGYVLWERSRAAQAAADGDRYFAAVDLAAAGDAQGSVAAFEELAADGVGAYPHLARLRIASTLAADGDRAGALSHLDDVVNSSAPQSLRDVAAVRAGYLLVDDGTPDDVRQRVERLTNESAALRHPAREALGLSLWRAGDAAAARPFFQQISEDLSAPTGIAQRASVMIEVIDSGAVLPEPGAAPPEPAPPASSGTPTLDGLLGAPAEGEAGPVDVPSEPVEADPTLTTPLAEQLDLPDAVDAPAEEAAPAETTTPAPAPSSDNSAPEAAPASEANPTSPPPS